jgi:[pyruvate, water dikinase]-phosphate phosphotransferase / [pyruvate, water dikinase] kinase
MFNQTISQNHPLVVYTLSDASGQTAELMARAVISQFQKQPVKLIRLPRLQSTIQIENMVKLAAQNPCIFAFTIVQDDLKACLIAQAERYNIKAVDLLGGLLTALSETLEESPLQEAGLIHARDEEYFKRMDAIEFAIKYDDGKSPSGLLQADIVLVGVSRTSKTPTCMYLAQNQGLKAGNIPLVPGVEPPRELFDFPVEKIIGLTVKPHLLTEIRTSRLPSLGLPPQSSYANSGKIMEELEFAQTIFRRLGCPVVDVTHKAIEETASEILSMRSNLPNHL